MEPGVDPLIGTRAGSYELTGILGEGGMGRIYRAEHPDLGKAAAVKVLSLALASSADTIRRFKLEARAVTRIGHPNIIEVFDFGTLPDGRPFYTMTLLEGESLGEHLARVRQVSVQETLSILGPVLDALGAAHAARIVHRDLKPDNIFLEQRPGRSRRVMLLDFGIAKVLDDVGRTAAAGQTKAGALMGTPSYMATEQAAGQIDRIGPQTDVYSIGVIIFQLLSGTLPFRADNLGALLLEHLNTTAPTLAEKQVEGVSAELSALVARCMAKDPADRPADASQLAAELQALGHQLPQTVVGQTDPGMHRPPTWSGNTSLSGAAAQVVTAQVSDRGKKGGIRWLLGGGAVIGVAAATAMGLFAASGRGGEAGENGGSIQSASQPAPAPPAALAPSAPVAPAPVTAVQPPPTAAPTTDTSAATEPGQVPEDKDKDKDKDKDEPSSELEKRLQALKDLHEQELISDDEYDKRRQEILDEAL